LAKKKFDKQLKFIKKHKMRDPNTQDQKKKIYPARRRKMIKRNMIARNIQIKGRCPVPPPSVRSP